MRVEEARQRNRRRTAGGGGSSKRRTRLKWQEGQEEGQVGKGNCSGKETISLIKQEGGIGVNLNGWLGERV